MAECACDRKGKIWLSEKIPKVVDLFPSNKRLAEIWQKLFFQKQFTVVYGSTLSGLYYLLRQISFN
jgi:hypothetical protein